MSGPSIWTRVDFHLHTPGVYSFETESNLWDAAREDKIRFAQQYAERLADACIEVAAITDYNGVRPEWFGLIKDAAAGLGITVLPGAELTIREGQVFHVLAVFPAGMAPDEVNSVIRSLDKENQKPLWKGKGNREIDPLYGTAEALLRLKEKTGCLLIPAHADDNKSGLVGVLGGKRAAQLMQQVRFDAMDHPAKAMEKVKSTGSAHSILERLAVVEFSDCKRLDHIGQKAYHNGIRQTWLKLSEPSLDAIRFALHDPSMRVRTSPPNPAANARIVSMKVEGTGFLGGCEVEFDPHLNTVIGAFGTGKTTLLEVLAYGLEARGLDDEDSPELALVRHALGDGGKVSIAIECPGAGSNRRRYVIERVFGRTATVSGDAGPKKDLSPRSVFSADHEPILLRHESIADLSKSDERCRNLFDRMAGGEVETVKLRLQRVQTDLENNVQQLARFWKLEEERSALRPRLAALQEKTADYDKSGVVEKLASYNKAKNRRHLVGVALSSLESRTTEDTGWRHDLKRLTGDVSVAAEAFQDDPDASNAQARLSEVAATVQRASGSLENTLSVLLKEVQEIDAAAESRLTAMGAAYDEQKRQLDADGLDPYGYERARAEATEAERRLKVIDLELIGFDDLREERERLLDELEQLRQELTAVRKATAQRMNTRLTEQVRVRVVPRGDVQGFTSVISGRLQGSGMTAEAKKLMTTAEGGDGRVIAAVVSAGVETIRDRFGITEAQARRAHTHLADPTGLAKLEHLAPDDLVEITLDGKPLEKLSAGGRATAVLHLVFSGEGRCLIIDQPEDDLDNRFIYDSVVQMIRRDKKPGASGRQIIAATHNPNIPVNGDADLVAVMEADESQAVIALRGSVDSAAIRDRICALLEGGEEAFRRRAERYRHSPA